MMIIITIIINIVIVIIISIIIPSDFLYYWHYSVDMDWHIGGGSTGTRDIFVSVQPKIIIHIIIQLTTLTPWPEQEARNNNVCRHLLYPAVSLKRPLLCHMAALTQSDNPR